MNVEGVVGIRTISMAERMKQLMRVDDPVTGRESRRCAWTESDPLLRTYHDEEWGVPERHSRVLWETLMLEGFQAGLSWTIILRKRAAFRRDRL